MEPLILLNSLFDRRLHSRVLLRDSLCSFWPLNEVSWVLDSLSSLLLRLVERLSSSIRIPWLRAASISLLSWDASDGHRDSSFGELLHRQALILNLAVLVLIISILSLVSVPELVVTLDLFLVPSPVPLSLFLHGDVILMALFNQGHLLFLDRLLFLLGLGSSLE